MNNIAILASGSGTNAEAIVDYFSSNNSIQVVCIISNKANAGVLDRAQRLGIPAYVFSNIEMREGIRPLTLLSELGVNLVVLAGYLNLISEPWLEAYPDRIINIHPALLPRYGGKGMYGQHVHEAVIAAREAQSGITIHLINERYDEGRFLLQATCPVFPSDTPESLAQRIHTLEHRFYPSTIEQFILHELIR
ncbi:MAG: phosphoribosylglycinamide formyltransferase [Porphyromonas sp.]|nr:phosphoribosylglycinamide formyltransferase [Porphyromonas sp.]